MTGTNETAARRLALLIDVDNVSNKLLPTIVQHAAELGSLVIRRAYGNADTWSRAAIKNRAKELGINPVLVIPATAGKGENAADMKLAIEAVDFLHRGNIDGVCIASSDGDFASLVTHLRENGLWVCGFGEAKTPDPYRIAFNHFVVIGEKAPARRPKAAPTPAPVAVRVPAPVRVPAKPPQPAPRPPASRTVPPELTTQILDAVRTIARKDGWASLSAVGQHLRRLQGFNSRKYGGLRDMLASLPNLELDETKSASGSSTSIKVRMRGG